MHSNPLEEPDLTSPSKIALSTGGSVCLVAYWVFSSTVFDSKHPEPEMRVFPEHFAILDKFLQDDAHAQIQSSVGTIEALVTIGLWLQSNNFLSSDPTSPLTNPTTSPEDPTSDFMRYVHLTTLIALYHPAIQVRNAASVLAGLILHADPEDDDRLKVLEDLLENCMFATLKARAVAWLREELIAASTSSVSKPQQTLFATPQALEAVQYSVFPPLAHLRTLVTADVVEYLSANAPFLIQAANFALFLFGGGSTTTTTNEKAAEAEEASKKPENKWAHILPNNMEATVRERWLEPLREAAERVEKERVSGELEKEGVADLGPLGGELGVLRERVGRFSVGVGAQN